MTLDEAIAISDEIGKGDTVRAANNRWLAEKLRILKWVEECHVIGEARRARVEMHRWQTECVRLKDENTKLRELAAEMYEAVKCCCDGCWFGYGHNPAKCKNENCGYRKEYVAMRELGVEAK